MKREINTKLIIFSILAATCFYACKKDAQTANVNVPHNGFNKDNSFTPIVETNLVANTLGYGAHFLDPSLVNPWGIAAPPNGPIWIGDNGMHLSSIYNRKTGAIFSPPVAVLGATVAGSPTGAVFNPNASDFGGYKFIFASEDGTISAWKLGVATTVVVDNSGSGSVYKGLAIAFDGTANYLYATNFHNGTIDVFDTNFNPVPSRPAFYDPAIPPGYAPFGIENIGGDLYVTYAKQKGSAKMDDQPGLGNGYVDVYDNHGSFARRFAAKGDLDSPWGIALAPAGYVSSSENILVGNFGSGRIDMYDLDGTYQGQLLALSKHLTIDGLWSIDFLKGNRHGVGSATDSLYFTAGPNGEADGLFGILTNH